MERILDRSEWIEQPDGRRLLWIAEDRKPWTAVVKRTGNGEVYLQSYRRAQLDEVMKWRDGWRSLGDRNLPRGTFVRLG